MTYRSNADLTLIVLLVSAALALGCAPTRVWTVPEMKGVIRQGAQPVPDAAVVWVAWEIEDVCCGIRWNTEPAPAAHPHA